MTASFAAGPAGSHQVAAERRLIERAEQVILLIDSSKFQSSGNVVCDLDEIDIVVTDKVLSVLITCYTAYGSSVAFYRRTSTTLSVRDRWVLEGALSSVESAGGASMKEANDLLNTLSSASSPGQTVFIGPQDLRFAMYNDTHFYFLPPKLRPASRYLELSPGIANREDSRLSENLERADWIVQTSRYDLWFQPNASRVPGPSKPNEIVSSRFCLYSTHGGCCGDAGSKPAAGTASGIAVDCAFA